MLQFIIGRSGCGKTHYITNSISRKVESGHRKIIYLVPEQQSFATEKAMLNILGAVKAQHVNVLTFSRLSDYVFRTIGGNTANAVDEGVKNIIMSLAIEQCKDELTLYRGQVNKPEIIGLMLAAVKEFKMCAVSTNQLREASKSISDENFKQKIIEIALITDVYNALLNKSYTDPLDSLTKLKETLEKNNIFSEFDIYIDGFNGFTVQEQNVLEQLMLQADNMYVALSGDEAEFSSGSTLFYASKRTTRQLTKTAKNRAVPIADPVYLNVQHRYDNIELKSLEESFFRQCALSDRDEVNYIKIFECKNIYEEASAVACEIKRLTMECGYSYKDIAVVCRSLDNYKGILNTVFDKLEIAYFMDASKEITQEPLVVFALSALEAVISSFSTDSILKLLKCGLCGFSAEDIAQLENYVFIWSISGKRWLSPFTANPKGYADEMTPSDTLLLEKLEKMRKEIITPLVKFRENITDANGLEISKALFLLTEKFNVPGNLKEISQRFEEYGELNLAAEQERIWNVFIEALDQMAAVLKDTYVTPKRYSELFKLVIGCADIFSIPSSLDEVTIGTADRIRFDKPKAVFVIGANEGEFPNPPASNGIFSDSEQKLLLSLNLPLYDSAEELAMQEDFLCYFAASAPSERLYVSYYKESLKGEAISPSVIVREILRLKRGIAVTKPENIYWADNLWSPQQAFEQTARYITCDKNATELYEKYFKNIPDINSKFNTIKRFISNEPFRITDKEISKKLFGAEQMTLSASQVEKYYLCRFQYFCRYGMSVKERKKAEVDSAEYGSLIHHILEIILQNHSVDELAAYDDNEIQDMLSDILDNYLAVHFGGKEDKSKRYLYMLQRMKNSSLELVKHIIKELSQSEFTPVDFELSINTDGDVSPYSVTSKNGTNVLIHGYVDRVDILKKENKAYIRVVDYKTGNKKFVLSDILFGLNLQMLIYLYAIKRDKYKRYGENVEPAGVLYMPSAASAVNAKKTDTEEEINQKKESSFKMNGLIIDDIEIIKAMEKEGRGVYIPVSLKQEKRPKPKKGEEASPEEPKLIIDKGAEYLVDKKKMEKIFSTIDRLITDMADSLTDGVISAVPAKGTYDACKWCPYKSVCGFAHGMYENVISVIKDPFKTDENNDADNEKGGE
ncbi:MAG: PD-(D/E)XK nuclease family protein [Acutalibacteraceae bacterium]